jgi:hypothetical protein
MRSAYDVGPQWNCKFFECRAPKIAEQGCRVSSHPQRMRACLSINDTLSKSLWIKEEVG